MLTKFSMDLVNDGKRQIENLTLDDTQREMAAGNVMLIDLRESDEFGVYERGSFRAWGEKWKNSGRPVVE